MTTWAPGVGKVLFIADWNSIRHLYVILNNPLHIPKRGGEVCLLTNISSCGGRFDDLTCTLAGGCHPFITRPSYVVYSQARVERANDIGFRVAQGLYFPDPDSFDAQTVAQILKGFGSSPHTNADRRELVVQILAMP